MSESVQIAARTNPMMSNPYQCLVEAGKTIDELFPGITEQAQVQVNGETLPRKNYDEYQLKEDDIISILVFPQGSREQGKNIARQVALLALVAAAPYVGQAAAIYGNMFTIDGLTQAGLAFSKVIGAATIVAGSQLISPLKLKRTGL